MKLDLHKNFRWINGCEGVNDIACCDVDISLRETSLIKLECPYEGQLTKYCSISSISGIHNRAMSSLTAFQREGFCITNVVCEKCVCLPDGLELSSNQRPGILHDIARTNWRYVESIYVGRLQPDGVYPLLFVRPLRVAEIPDVLYHPKQDCVEYLDRRVLRWIKP